MKRTVIFAIVLAGVFAFGYWTARSPLVIREEMPGAERMAELREIRTHQVRAQIQGAQIQGTQDFLEKVLVNAEAEYKRTGTAESKAEVDRLKERLEEVRNYWITRRAAPAAPPLPDVERISPAR